MPQPIISAVGLSKVFRDFWRRARIAAVRDVDFEVQPGEIYGLLGPNGSGKSTTIKMILGLLHPTRGRVTVFGQPPDNVRTKRRIGYLPEESYLYRFLTARETLDYYASLFQLERSVRRRRIDELLEMVGLRSAARRPVGEFSKGMARRVGLAQALINDPDLLILDEPTSGLDPIGAKLVKDIIVRLGEVHRKTILLSSHLLADVEEVCDQVAILFGGRVQVSGSMEQVLARTDLMQLNTEKLSEETIAAVRNVIAEREGKQVEVATPHDRLQELFLRIVAEANAKRVETAGSTAPGAIASFLGSSEAPSGRQVLEELVQPVAPEPTATEPVAPAKPAVDDHVLASLTNEKSADAESGEAEAADEQSSKSRAVDRGLLAELSGRRDEDERQS